MCKASRVYHSHITTVTTYPCVCACMQVDNMCIHKITLNTYKNLHLLHVSCVSYTYSIELVIGLYHILLQLRLCVYIYVFDLYHRI